MAPWLLPVLLLIACASYTSATIRGLNPALAAYYTGADGIFACIDGSGKIPFGQVNDNYADCFDGSDEPGTSASYSGRFYCANKGHEPQLLASAFVDDGVCDCCDGSDEVTGCTNTCLDKSSGRVKELSDSMASYQDALTKRAAAMQAAAARRAGWASRMHTIHTEVAAKDSEVQAALEEQARAQKLKEEREAEREAERQRQQAEEEAKRAQKEAAKAATEPEPVQAQQDTVDATQPPPAHEETVEERGRRIASQWTQDPEAAAVDHEAEGEEEAQPYEHEEPEEEPEFGDGHEQEHHVPHHHHHHHYQDDAELRAATAKVTALQSELAALRKEHEDMVKYSQQGVYDFGPNDVYFALAGRCLKDSGTRFTYEACFFDNASQGEGHAQLNKRSLGTWRGWANDYKMAIFDGGDPCDNAPARSLRVHLLCGANERMYGGSEPSTCTYETWLETPQACTEAEYRALTAELLALEGQRAKLKAEIDAEMAARGKHDEL